MILAVGDPGECARGASSQVGVVRILARAAKCREHGVGSCVADGRERCGCDAPACGVRFLRERLAQCFEQFSRRFEQGREGRVGRASRGDIRVAGPFEKRLGDGWVVRSEFSQAVTGHAADHRSLVSPREADQKRSHLNVELTALNQGSCGAPTKLGVGKAESFNEGGQTAETGRFESGDR